MSTAPDSTQTNATAPTLRRLLSIAWSHRTDCLQLLGLQLILVVFTVAVFVLTGIAIDFIRHCADANVPAPSLPFFIPKDSDNVATLWWLSGGIIVIALLRAALSYVFGLGAFHARAHRG